MIKYHHRFIVRQFAVSDASVLTWFLAHGGVDIVIREIGAASNAALTCSKFLPRRARPATC